MDKCLFGDSRSRVYKRSDFGLARNFFSNNFYMVSPSAYKVDTKHTLKASNKYTMRPKYLRLEDIVFQKEIRPAGANYSVNDELVKSTRHVDVNAGGSSPKVGLKIAPYPGPGQYEASPSMYQK